MKRYWILAKKDEISLSIEQVIDNALSKHLSKDELHPDLLITVGGDGTMLRAVQLYLEQLETVHFVGIHTGTLGFYTDYEANEVEQLIQDILYEEYTINKMNMVEVNYQRNQANYRHYGLNEARIENIYSTLVCDIKIDNEFLETFRGNGLCISSTSGSTAYNRSLGGSVITPNIPIIQLSEIAGIHHNAYRSLQSSLILDQQHTIYCELKAINKPVLGVDQLIFDIDGVKQLEFKLSKRYVQFIHYRSISFFDRIRKAFING